MVTLEHKKIIIGVTGSIAAYKIAGLCSMLKKQKADVTVIMTQNATNFIHPITFETLTGNKCLIDTFDRNFQYDVEHVELAKAADVFLVAPASANVIAKAAHGIADDMLTTTLLAATCPKLFAPAMNTRMYQNEITQDNLWTLEKYGMKVITPANGYLACGDTGEGRSCRLHIRLFTGFERKTITVLFTIVFFSNVHILLQICFTQMQKENKRNR